MVRYGQSVEMFEAQGTIEMKFTEASRKLSDCRDMKMVFSFPMSKMKANNHRNS